MSLPDTHPTPARSGTPVRTGGEKRGTLLRLRGCVAAATGAILWLHAPAGAAFWLMLLAWGLYVGSTAAYVFLPLRLFMHRRFDFVFIGLELFLLGTFFTAYGGWDGGLFYPLFLVVVLVAALARRLSWALVFGATGAVVQALLLGDASDGAVLILQAAVLMTAAALVGYLTEALDREEGSSALLRNALEVSTLMAGTLEADAVYERLTEIVARLFDAGRVAVILAGRETGKAHVAAAIDRGRPVRDVVIDLERYPEIQTALRTLEQVIIDRAGEHPRMAEVRADLPHRARAAAILVTPIHQGGTVRGVIFVRLEGPPHRPFTDHEMRFCTLMASVAARTLQRAEDFAAISETARRDGLTGLYNVREFQRILREEVSRCERIGATCSLLMIDVDFLKHVNDTYGHPAGDQVLRSLAASLLKQAREIDTVARYGGEEFAMLLPETGGDRALLVAERLRDEIEHVRHEGVDGCITVSIGVAAFPEDATSAADLLHKADQALYSSKNRGRNRAVRFEPVRLIEPGGTGNEPRLSALRSHHDSSMVRIIRDSLSGPSTHRHLLRHIDVIACLAAVMNARDPTAVDHLRDVSTLAELFLSHLPVPDRQRWSIHIACLLRDIGKLAVADAILDKRDFLTRKEYESVRLHAEVGAQIVEPLKGLDMVVPLIRHHHERWDGRGYPDGLQGNAIPYGARVVALVDAFHAMARRESHAGKGRGLAYACDEIRGNAGTQFDPQLAERFLFVVQSNPGLIESLLGDESTAPAAAAPARS